MPVLKEFYKIKEERRAWLGERYFRFDDKSTKVLQVVAETVTVKKGRTNTVGIILISRLTFLSNYLPYIEEIDRERFDLEFENIVRKLTHAKNRKTI